MGDASLRWSSHASALARRTAQQKFLREQVQAIASDPSNGAIVVFSFADDLAIANAAIAAGACGFISKATPATQIVDGIKAAATRRARHVDQSITARGDSSRAPMARPR